MEENHNKIEIITEEQIAEKKYGTKKSYVTYLSMLFISLLFFATLSFFSINGVKKCAEESKNPSPSTMAIWEMTRPPETSIEDFRKIREKGYFSACLNTNLLAENILVILAISINFIGIFILSLLYLYIFDKSENSVKLGRAVIISLIFSAISLLRVIFGFLGMIVAFIFGIYMLKKILRTDIIGAIIFNIIIGLSNAILISLIAKIFAH